MKIKELSFRHGIAHRHPDERAWVEIQEVLKSITRERIIREYISYYEYWSGKKQGKKLRPPVGGQTILNELIKSGFGSKVGWESQIPVLRRNVDSKVSSDSTKMLTEKAPYWTMDFKNGLFGVESCFNNAGMFAQNLLRLSVMSESTFLQESDKIKLGFLIVPSMALKEWSQMDSTVITFEQVETILPYITFSIPTPLVIIGLFPEDEAGVAWQSTRLFGNKTDDFGPKPRPEEFSKLTLPEKSAWEERIKAELIRL
jgi:hypothetical protein